MPFHSPEFVQELQAANEKLVFSGVGVHDQNGVAQKKNLMGPHHDAPCGASLA